MYQIFNFISNNKSFLLFIFLELVALGLVINTHSFHQSKSLAFLQFYAGNIQQTSSDIYTYFSLKSVNKALTDDNTALKNQISLLKQHQPPIKNDTDVTFSYTNARVIHNTFLNANNYLTLDKGANDGLKENMGVVTEHGLIGIIINTSPKFSKVLSLLNSKASFNVKLSKSNHFGSLKWNGKDFRIAQLYDIPVQAQIEVGDSIISGSYSLFFPENIPVGVIKDFTIDNKMYKVINIELFEDFSALNYTYIVNNEDQEELKQVDQFHLE